jgi:hypothetical protein
MKPLSRRHGVAWLAVTVLAPAAWSPVRAAPSAPGEAVAWPQVWT